MGNAKFKLAVSAPSARPEPRRVGGACMFTGLVEGMGAVTQMVPEGPGVRLSVAPPAGMADGGGLGESIAINGCCLTIVGFGTSDSDSPEWEFQAGPETLARTNLGGLAPGSRVNLERALPVTGRLGGHFVQGHIDGTGLVDAIVPDGEWVTYWFRVSPALTAQMVSKGSIAVDGISLTLVDVEPERFSVALIPHTLAVTTLGLRRPGDVVNIETDILAKYAQKLLGGKPANAFGQPSGAPGCHFE